MGSITKTSFIAEKVRGEDGRAVKGITWRATTGAFFEKEPIVTDL